MYLITTPEIQYHPIEAAGPYHPTSSASFFENKTISRRGLEKLEYRFEKL